MPPTQLLGDHSKLQFGFHGVSYSAGAALSQQPHLGAGGMSEISLGLGDVEVSSSGD